MLESHGEHTFGCKGSAPLVRGRYAVNLAGKMVALQPSNVILPAGARVKVCGLQGAAQHNGKIAKIVELDRAAMRYLVQLTSEQQLKIKLENCLL